MKPYTLSAIVVGVVAFVSTNVIAQQPVFEEENFPSPASSIRHVLGIGADKNNCLWFATQTGIYRFDGFRFKNFSVSNTPVLQFERMAGLALLQSRKESRWCIEDTKGGVYEIDSESRVQPFKYRKEEEELIFYHQYGMRVLDPQKGNIPKSIASNARESYYIASQQKIWGTTMAGEVFNISLADFYAGKPGKKIYKYKFTREQGNTGNQSFVLNDNFYLISEGAILRWKGSSDTPDKISLSGDIMVQDKNKIGYTEMLAYKTTEPNITLLVNNGSIYEINESAGINQLRTRLLAKYEGNEYPITLYYSPSQQIFISYFLAKGLLIYRPRQFDLLSWDKPDDIIKREDYYYSLFPGTDGFITMNDHGLIWLGINGDKKMIYAGTGPKFFFFRDRQENLWFIDKKNYLNCLRKSADRPMPLLLKNISTKLAGMFQFNDSIYYILDDRTLERFVFSDGKIHSDDSLYQVTQNIQLNFLYPFNSHLLWLGGDRGMIEFDLHNNSAKKISALDNTYLRAVSKLEEDNYIVGSYDKGIFQYINGQWIHLSSPGRKMPASAHAFIIDSLTSSVWVSSNEGLLRIPLNQLLKKNSNHKGEISFRHFTNFGSNIPAEFNGSSNISGAKLSDTIFAFANARGLVVFNPKKLLLSPLPVNVLVESLNDNDSLPLNKLAKNRIEFNPVVPYFGNLQELDIQYMLTNSEDNWHKLAPNSVISYNNLKPGDHELKFMVRHQHEPEEKELILTATSFSVNYKWYQRPWVRWAAAIFLLVVILIIHNFRIWYLRKRKKDLEKIVADQTGELQETNQNLQGVIDELTDSETNLKQSNFLKDEYFAVLTHDLRSPVKFLSFNISQLLDQFNTLDKEALKKGLYIAYECSNDVYKLIDEFVYWIQENEKQLVAQPKPTIISAMVADAKKLYEYNLTDNKNIFVSNVDPELIFITDPKLLFIILRNAIDNANKYCSGGRISVTANRQSGHLHITIDDTGRGIGPELVQQLTALQYENVQLGYKQRKSLGFYIMAMFTKKLGGAYTIDSSKEKGTHLHFIFPELNLKP